MTTRNKLIENFSSFCNYSINWQKSSILPLHIWDVATHTPPIPIRMDYITYLGIYISPRLSDLYSHNYPPLLNIIIDKLLCWMNLPHRIATVKMTILPRMNYLFTMIPTPLLLVQITRLNHHDILENQSTTN